MSVTGIIDLAVFIIFALCSVAAVLVILRRPLEEPVPTGAPECDEAQEISLVALPVVVSDKHGRFVPGLQQDDFQVFEDGKPQSIVAFQEEDVPVTVGLVIDHSESMRWRSHEVEDIAAGFLASIDPHDELFVVSFNESPFMCLPQHFFSSQSAGQCEGAMFSTPAEGETALYDAILLAMEQLKQRTRERKSLVIVSDGDDNASRAHREEVLVAAEKNSVLIYTLGIFAIGQTGSDPEFLRKLANITGGKAHTLDCASKFPGIGRKVAQELHEQYTLVYASSDGSQADTFRRVRVKACIPDHKKMFVRTRAGYAVQDRSVAVSRLRHG